MTESENENDHFDLDHFDHYLMRKNEYVPNLSIPAKCLIIRTNK